jgi:hypothetical protein
MAVVRLSLTYLRVISRGMTVTQCAAKSEMLVGEDVSRRGAEVAEGEVAGLLPDGTLIGEVNGY